MIDPNPSGTSPVSSVSTSAEWPLWQKIGFRFFFVFFILYCLLVPSDVLLHYGNIFYPFINWFQFFIIWAAKSLFHLSVMPVTRSLGDSGGDATFDYLLYLFVLLVAATATAIWSYTGRKTRNYNLLFHWLLVVLRYFVAFTFIFFGAAKVFLVQFPAPNIGRLMERVGDMSPMGLAWTYMGYSRWFNYFTGGSELLCAGLLFFRRTTRAGVVMGIVLLLNIVAINFCFDVCVKISSTTLLLMCLFILVPDYGNFILFFFGGQNAAAFNRVQPALRATYGNKILSIVKYGLIAYALYWNYGVMTDQVATYGDGRYTTQKAPLAGLYQVETFVRGHDTLKPLTTDTIRWRCFWISRPGTATVQLMNDSTRLCGLQVDTLNHKLTLAKTAAQRFDFGYMTQGDGLVLVGRWKGDSIIVRMHKVDLNNFRLINRGFHMINEGPYNR
ncbi:MAG: hypothetical protein V4577_18875 [Bacteroidota bacterium]